MFDVTPKKLNLSSSESFPRSYVDCFCFRNFKDHAKNLYLYRRFSHSATTMLFENTTKVLKNLNLSNCLYLAQIVFHFKLRQQLRLGTQIMGKLKMFTIWKILASWTQEHLTLIFTSKYKTICNELSFPNFTIIPNHILYNNKSSLIHLAPIFCFRDKLSFCGGHYKRPLQLFYMVLAVWAGYFC